MKLPSNLSEVLTIYAEREVDLLDNAKTMGLNPHGAWNNLTFTQLKQTMADAILADPLPILRQLSREELELLQKLVQLAPGKGIIMHVPKLMLNMAMMGLVVQQVYDENKDLKMVLITSDFKAAILPHLNAVMEDPEVKDRFHAEEYLFGALNLYGVLTTADLKKVLKECLELEDDGSSMFDYLYKRSLPLRMAEIGDVPGRSDNLFISPFISFFGEIMNKRSQHKDINAFKHFSPNVIRLAGNMPIPTLPNPVDSTLLQMMQIKLGYSEQEALYWRFIMWLTVQEWNASEAIQKVLEHAPEYVKSNTLNDMMPIFFDYLDHAPRWILRGYSPVDINKPHNSEPIITFGSGIREDDFDSEEFLPEDDLLWNSPKVGRNDPCPCGSGKKYKHCCGRNA